MEATAIDPSFRRRLNLVKDELDSHQINVELTPTSEGVRIKANNYADRLLAKRELERQHITVLAV
jgi:hypothetical protein